MNSLINAISPGKQSRYQSSDEHRVVLLAVQSISMNVNFLQHFALTKDDELKAGPEDSMCVEGATDSVMLVFCDDNSKQWKISQVQPTATNLSH